MKKIEGEVEKEVEKEIERETDFVIRKEILEEEKREIEIDIEIQGRGKEKEIHVIQGIKSDHEIPTKIKLLQKVLL